MSEHPKDGNEEYDSDVVEEDADRKEDDGCLSVSRQDKKTSSLRQRGKAKATSTITEGSSINSVTDENVSKPAKVSTKSVIIRTVSAVVMTVLYLLMLRGGHTYCMLVGLASEVEMFRELLNVRYVEAKEKSIPLFRTLQWSWFALVMACVHGGGLHNFCLKHYELHYISKVTHYLDYIVFVGGCILLMASVLTFRADLIRFQISQTVWTVFTTSLVIALGHVFAKNIMNGLFWFFFPMATVVMNDVSAYFCGITFGKKFISSPFLSLSPNKTWEGFIGAAVLTLIFSCFFPLLLAQYEWFTCPKKDALELTLFPTAIHCDVNPVFKWTEYKLGDQVIPYMPIQLHGMVYGLFASLVSPFGGFFASAIKRAYGKKDFDSFMPGHGGLVDRMDCQIVMISFCYVHYRTFIRTFDSSAALKDALTLLTVMSSADKETLYKALVNAL